MTAQKTWTAGDVLTAADMNLYARGGQEMGYAAITANSAAFTAFADVSGLSVTWTAISTRVYELEFIGNVSSTVTADAIQIQITDSANTPINSSIATNLLTTQIQHLYVKARLTGVSGSVTYKIRAARNTGTGTTVIEATTQRPSALWVRDVGAN